MPTRPIAAAASPAPFSADSLAEAVAVAYARLVSSTSKDLGGEYRKYACPADDPGSWVKHVPIWAKGSITGPWFLPAETARQACDMLVCLLVDVRPSATVEIRRLCGTKYTVVFVAMLRPGEEPELAAVFHPESAAAGFVAAFNGAVA